MWSKTIFAATDQYQSRSLHPRVRTFPSASAIFKCILEVVFCEGVQQSLRFCLDHLSSVKMAASELCQSVKQKRKVSGGRQTCWFW
jgi:hypothetical protein